MDRVRRFLICGLLASALATLVACGGSSSSANTNTTTAPPALSSVTLNPASVTGGQSSTATVTLSGPAQAGGFRVTLGTSSGSVTLPSDMLLTIPQGAMSGTFRIDTIPVGSNQTAQITVTYLSLVSVQATLSIVSANPLMVTGFTVSPSTAPSGQTLIGTLTLSSPALSPGQQVFIASTDLSVVQPESPVTVPTNQATTSFNIFTSAITTQRNVTLTANLNASSIPVQLTMQPGAVGVTALNVVPPIAAGGQSMTGTVTLSIPAPAPSGATVQLAAMFTNPATPAGTPLPVTIPASVPVPAGATQAQFTIKTIAVTKTTNVTISATLNTSAFFFTVGIVPSISLAGISCLQGSVTSGNTLACSVSLNIPAPAGGQVVQLSSNNTTALAVPQTITIPAGASSQGFTLTGGTASTTTAVTLTASLQGATTGSVTTMVNVVPVSAITLSSFVLSATAVQGGPGPAGSVTGTLTISAAAPPGGLVIGLSSSDPSAQFPNGPTVTVVQNATSVSFPITTTAVSSQVNVTLTASLNGGTSTAMLAVVPPPVITSVSVNPTSVVGGNSATGTIMLQSAAPQGGAAVTLKSSSTMAQFAGTVTVPAGATSATFLVTTLPVTTTLNVIITASFGASSQQTMLTILPPTGDVRLLFFNPATIVAGGLSTGTVVLSAPAPSGGTTVTLSSNASTVTVPASVTVPQGATSATFTAMSSASATSATVTATVTASVTNALTVLAAPTAAVSEQIVLGGDTNSTDFPGASSGAPSGGSYTGFVSSITQSTPAGSPTSSAFAFSTYLGGTASQVRDVFVDSSRNVFVCGVTSDPNLPTTANAAQSKSGGGQDAFIAEFNSSGALQYLSYLGGSGDETCYSVTFDPSSSTIVVIGKSSSTDLAGTPSTVFQPANAGGNDFFVARINPTGTSASTRLVWLTFVGGTGDDFADGRMVLDAQGDVFLTGTTKSTAPPPGGFPIPPAQARPSLTGVGTAGVVLGISADGSSLLFTTLLFGRANGASPGTPTTTTASGGIAFANSSLYVCGQTNASDLPVSANAVQVALKGQQDGYLAVINGIGNIAALTYLGGTSATQACKGVAVDHDNQPMIVMPTDASDYPVTGTIPANLTQGGRSHFAVTKLTSDLSTVIFSTLLGGGGNETADATRLMLDNSENLYFSLATTSGDFPVTPNAIRGMFAGTPLGTNRNVAVVKLSSDGSTILYSSFLGGSTDNSTTSVFYHLN